MTQSITENTYKAIPSELLQWFETLPGIKVYSARTTLYLEGEKAEQFYYLKKGRVRIYVTSENGAQKVLALYKSHNVFGEASFFDGMPRMSSAETIEKSEIIIVKKDDILHCFKEQPTLALAMIQSLSKTVRMLSSQIHQMSFLSADKRIIQLLLLESGAQNTVISCTQEEIGTLVGCSRVTVSRTLKKLENSGCLAISYGGITVQDSELLKYYMYH